MKLVPTMSSLASSHIAKPFNTALGADIVNVTPEPAVVLTIHVYLKPAVKAGNVYAISLVEESISKPNTDPPGYTASVIVIPTADALVADEAEALPCTVKPETTPLALTVVGLTIVTIKLPLPVDAAICEPCKTTLAVNAVS